MKPKTVYELKAHMKSNREEAIRMAQEATMQAEVWEMALSLLEDVIADMKANSGPT